MSGNWTAGASGAPGRAGRRSARGAAVASLLALLALASLCASCGKTRTKNVIKGLLADVTVNYASIPDPGVYFRKVSPPTMGSDGDVVVLDVVLRSTSPMTFDAFDLHLKFDPHIVMLAASPTTPPLADTPFGACNAALTSPSGPGCVPTVTLNPFCESSAGLSLADLLIGVSVVTSHCFPSCTMADSACTSGRQDCADLTKPCTQSSDVTLLTIAFQGAAVGTSTIKFVPAALTGKTGDCEILYNLAQVTPVVTFDDGGATITVTR